MLTSYNDGEIFIFFLCSGPMGVIFSLRTRKKFPVEFSILRLFFEPDNALTTSKKFFFLRVVVCFLSLFGLFEVSISACVNFGNSCYI